MSKALLKEIGDGSLWLGGSGQHTEPLRTDPVAKANQPPVSGRCDTCYLLQYEGTEFIQWVGRRSDGRFHPYGKILQLTDAGHALLSGGPS